MSYIVIGGGPAGLSLAYMLATNNYHVTLIEKNYQCGGSWNETWQDGYWSENAPRVCVSPGPHIDFMTKIGINKNDFENVYGNFFETNLKVMKTAINYLSLSDYIKLFLSKTYYIFHENDNKTMKTWMTTNNISESGKRFLEILCITVNHVPEKTNCKVFFQLLNILNPFIQFKEPNKWVTLVESEFEKMCNVRVLKNTSVVSFENIQNKITCCVCFDNETHNYYKLSANKYVLCTQSTGLLPILKNSSKIVYNNWKKDMANWVQNTYYGGFGFQLHFQEKVKFPESWCWSCDSDWVIIILPVSNWLKCFSKKYNIQTTWSCVVTLMDKKSSFLQRSLNECNKETALKECVRQIKEKINIPEPYKVTTSPGLIHKHGQWYSENTGFTQGKYDVLPMKGYCDNLFAVGCFNDDSSIALMKSAVQASVNYMKKYEKDCNIVFENKYASLHYLVVLIILFYVYKKM